MILPIAQLPPLLAHRDHDCPAVVLEARSRDAKPLSAMAVSVSTRTTVTVGGARSLGDAVAIAGVARDLVLTAEHDAVENMGELSMRSGCTVGVQWV